MRKLFFILSVSCLLWLAGCSIADDTAVDDVTLDLPDWTEATHGDSVPPNYDAVFTDDEVKRIDLVIDPDDWQDMLDDMTAKYGSFGSGGGFGPGGGPGQMSDQNPIFVPCRFFFDGREWYRVGVRFKGNSSLRSTWSQGIRKLALKLDFNQYGDDYPEITNQRFYGFRQLSMSNNFDDTSFLRERVVPEIFRELGVPAPHTGFCRVYIDHGEGSIYFGLYTMVEVVDDTVLEDQLGSNDGNCYKPEGPGATFAQGTFSEGDFVKKNNETAGDWSDILALFDAINDNDRLGNPQQWRNRLEALFNVDGFLRWLAVNTVIQNWDTYGIMYHNYYLYNDASLGLTWIPWDNNEALQEGKQGGALSLGLTEVNHRWPLIRYLMDDDTYRSIYISYVADVINGPFEPSKMIARYRYLHGLVQPYVTGADGEQNGYTFLWSSAEFDSALDYLITHVQERETIAEGLFNSNGNQSKKEEE